MRLIPLKQTRLVDSCNKLQVSIAYAAHTSETIEDQISTLEAQVSIAYAAHTSETDP